MLYAKKRSFNKTSNYLISVEKNKTNRESDICLGKLRANNEGDKYYLYDPGENYSKVNKFTLDKIRNEWGIFIYVSHIFDPYLEVRALQCRQHPQDGRLPSHNNQSTRYKHGQGGRHIAYLETNKGKKLDFDARTMTH